MSSSRISKLFLCFGLTLAGNAYFPSTGYVLLNGNGRPGAIHFAGMGVNSEDGFTGYPHAVSTPPPCAPPAPDGSQLCSARWGDYSAATVDGDGNLWMAAEYIGPRPRTVNANFGTFVTKLSGDD